MSMSIMNAFVSDEVDKDFMKAFSESGTASNFLKRFLPDEGNRMWFDSDECWLQLVNKSGKLWLEVGEAGA